MVFYRLICLFFLIHLYGSEIIEVDKRGVLYKFVRCNQQTDWFVERLFPSWENETFDVFDRVKDPRTIAIDLGAWIGTTSIWLSDHFYHVIAVEPDRESLDCLKRNLDASECNNVTICEQPVSDRPKEVIFGPRGNYLNESISFVKPRIDNVNDYTLEAIPFAQLLSDYVYSNRALYTHKIGFIKCDIEGGEEDILEDLLRFAYVNQSKVYLSFHVGWWRTKRIEDFSSLFNLFKTNCPEPDVCGYIQKNPFGSLLFEP